MSDGRRFGWLSDIPTEVSVCDRSHPAAKPNVKTVTDVTHASIRRFGLPALSKSEVALPEREVSGVRCVGMPSTSGLPRLR